MLKAALYPLIILFRHLVIPNYVKLSIVVFILLLITYVSGAIKTLSIQKAYSSSQQIVYLQQSKMLFTPTPTLTPTPTPFPSPTGKPQSTIKPTGNAPEKPSETATENTMQEVAGISTPAGLAKDMLEALNTYRQKKGAGHVVWDGRLGEYAQSRADYFAERGKLDEHAGFKELITSQDGFIKMGFYKLGENSSFGHSRMEAVFLIEEAYGHSVSHDANQLNTEYTHVGIGVHGSATNLIFGGKKIE